jgi:hypothetical protein
LTKKKKVHKNLISSSFKPSEKDPEKDKKEEQNVSDSSVEIQRVFASIHPRRENLFLFQDARFNHLH